MQQSRRQRSKFVTVLAIAVGGGMLVGGCETRLKEAIVEGSKNYFLNNLLPSLFLQDSTTEGSTASDNLFA